MDIVEITDENIEDFEELLGEDVTSDLSREFYRGIGAVDDDGEAKGVFVYELLAVDDDDEDTRSALRLLSADSEDTYSALHQAYREFGVEEDEIAESVYQFDEEALAASCEKEGFTKESGESEFVRFTLKEAGEIPFVTKVKKFPYYIASIGEISDEQYRAAVKNCLFAGQKGILEDFGYLKREWFDAELSTCLITDNEINGFFLVRATPSGILMPVLLYGYGADYVKNLVLMLARSIRTAEQKYPPETQIVVRRTKKATHDLMKKLFPKLNGKEAFFGSRAEEW